MGTTARERAEAVRCSAEGQGAFEAIARRFYAGVYNYLCWISRDRALAEDLTQETFMRIWEHPPELRHERALKAWVYRVARNEFLQHCRRAGLDTVPLGDCPEPTVLDPRSPAPEVHMAREALRQAVRRAVEKLPDHYREVIVLHNLEGLSLTQVAQVLEIPLGTVKSRRVRAFSLLRRLLAE